MIVIGLAALLSSILSAVAGLGGGVILLVVIAQFVTPTAAIPIQGAIQVVSNGSRARLLRHDVDWSVVGWSSLLLLPASFVGVALATALPDDAISMALAVFVLVLAWRPSLVSRQPSSPYATDPVGRRRMLIGVGATSGFLNTTVGASGPVTSPFFKAVTASHVAFVATAATTQVAAHVAKLVAFGTSGWNPVDHLDLIIVGSIGVIVGSWVGTRLLGKLRAQHLDLIFRLVLSALAIRLGVRALIS